MNFASLKSLWSRSPHLWSAIDCQDGLFGVSVKLPRSDKQKPQVLKHVSFPGQSLDAGILGQMGRTLGSSDAACLCVLGRKEYQIFMVDKPAVRQEEMERSLRWTVSPMIDYPATDANLAWLDIPSRQAIGNRVPQMYVISAKQDVINAKMAMFDQTRMPLDVMDVRETAQRNISLAIETPNNATCLVFAEAGGIQLTMTYQGEMYLERFISEPLGSKNGPPMDADQQSRVFDRLALEIQRSIDYVRRNHPNLALEHVTLAPTQIPVSLRDQLETRLVEPVKSLDLSDIFDWPEGSELRKPEAQAMFFHALGATLRISPKE